MTPPLEIYLLMMLPSSLTLLTYDQPLPIFFVVRILMGEIMSILLGGARRAGPAASLPFDTLQVWFKLWLQDTEFHNISIIRPVQTFNCAPPSDPWTSGCYDMVIINNDAGCLWPTSGLHGTLCSHVALNIYLLSSHRSYYQSNQGYHVSYWKEWHELVMEGLFSGICASL
jgi:hypothetical protein